MSGIEVALVVGLVAAAAAAVILLRPNQKGLGKDRRDLEVTDSAYGNFIPLARGRVRLTGDLIYARDLVKRTKKTGGKGGAPSQKETSYFLTGIYLMGDASVFGPAVSFGEVWADTELIYDPTGQSATEAKGDITLRFMYGTEEQEPDIIQVEDEGDLAQGFPFSVCIVVELLPLKYSGDRVPSLSAIVDYENPSNSGPLGLTLTGPDTGTDYFENNVYWIDYPNQKIYGMYTSGFQDPQVSMREYNKTTLEEVAVHDLTGVTTGAAKFYGIDQVTGYLYGAHATSGGSRQYVYDPDTLTWITDTFGAFPNNMIEFDTQHFPLCRSPDSTVAYVFSTDFDLITNYHSFPDLTYVGSIANPEPAAIDRSGFRPKWMTGTLNAKHGNITSDVWICWMSFDELIFEKHTVGNDGSLTKTTYTTIPIADIDPGVGREFNKLSIDWCPYVDVDGTIIVSIKTGVPSGSSTGSPFKYWIVKFSPLYDELSWVTEVTSGFFGDADRMPRYNTRLGSNRTLLMYDDASILQINTTSGAVQYPDPEGEVININFGSLSWDGINGCAFTSYDATTTFNVFREFCLSSTAPIGSVGLADIIREICTRVGLIEGTDFDVSAVTQTVWGWTINSREKANEALQDVMAPFFIQAGTQDGLIKFQERNSVSYATIDIDEFLVDQRRDEIPYTITQDDEAKIPSETNVGYFDPSRDYEPGNASYRRPAYPDLPFLSHEKLDMDTPFALTNLQSKEIAYKWTYIPWNERDKIKGKLSYNYLDLVGNDIVTFDFLNGSTKKARIEKAAILNDYTVEIEATFLEPGADQAATFASASGEYARISSLEPLPDTTLYVLDINLLRDEDDLARIASQSYMAVRAETVPSDVWIGSDVYRSSDQLDYTKLASMNADGIFATTLEAIDTPTDHSGTFFDATLDVTILDNAGDLASTTYESLLNGANPFIILKNDGTHEVCQFQTITSLGGGDYRLSILRRGQRGTDTMMGNNNIGDTVIFPKTNDMGRFSTSLTDIGMTRYFRPVSVGQPFTDAADQSEIITANDLKPYAPVNFAAVRGGSSEVTITFNRRTRVGAGVVNGEWRSPLNEATEAYEIDVYDGTGTTVVRTLTGTSESIDYTLANQTADGFTGSETDIWVEIFQISDIVGRGYSYKLNVEIT